jgi:hypothetical protein
VYFGHLIKQEHRYDYGSEAIQLMMGLNVGSDLALVEDAAFHKQMGQVGLAEVRFGFYFGLRQSGVKDVRMIPPMTARKLAFEDGRIQAMDVWPLLNHNAADSVAIALAALKLKEQESEQTENSG